MHCVRFDPRRPVGQRRELNNEFPGARPCFRLHAARNNYIAGCADVFFDDRAIFNLCPLRHASCAPIELVQFTALPVGSAVRTLLVGVADARTAGLGYV